MIVFKAVTCHLHNRSILLFSFITRSSSYYLLLTPFSLEYGLRSCTGVKFVFSSRIIKKAVLIDENKFPIATHNPLKVRWVRKLRRYGYSHIHTLYLFSLLLFSVIPLNSAPYRFSVFFFLTWCMNGYSGCCLFIHNTKPSHTKY